MSSWGRFPDSVQRASEYLVNDSKEGLVFSRARKGLASEHEKLEREE